MVKPLLRQHVAFLALGLFLLPLAAASAQEPDAAAASGSVSLSTEDGVATDGTNETTARGDDTAYMDRFPPEPFLWELGVFGGMIFPSDEHSLYPIQKPLSTRQGFASPSLDLGLRVAFFPLDLFGVEGEIAFIPTETDDGRSARWINARLHPVLQLPGSSVTPFLVAGIGTLNSDSDSMGADTDTEMHFGLGVKVAVHRYVSLRFDARDIVSNHTAQTGNWPSHFELLLGVSAVLGRSDRDGDDYLDTMDVCVDEPGIPPDGCVPEPDTDGDGFLDSVDKCPTVPGVAPDGCPPPEPDTDGDGFLDSVDKCPTVPGIAPDGCPDLDVDRDLILIPTDQCPEVPETKNAFQDADGCPDELPEEVKKFVGIIEGIEFDTAKATIRKASNLILDNAVKVLTDFGDLRVLISGHTDSVGSDEKNQTLSANRAAAVKTYLVGKGIADARIETRGAGESEPIDDNVTNAGRQKNRRIEFKLLE